MAQGKKTEAEKAEAERLAKEKAEKAEAERIAKEEAEKAETERIDKEEAEKAETERTAKEEAEKAEAERIAKEEAEKAEAERASKEKAEKPEAVFDRKTATFDEIAKEYSKHYPSCKAFYITSDRMVFLDGDLAAAREHAQGLKNTTVHTAKIK